MTTQSIDLMPQVWKDAMQNIKDIHEEPIKKATVIGGGSFGTSLAAMIARKGGKALVWVRDPEQAKKVNESRKNEKYLPDFTLEENIIFTSDVADACKDTQIILLALPTPFVRAFLVQNRSTFPVGVPILLCAKGIEVDSLQTPYEIVKDELPGKYMKHLGVLAGPSFAKEMMKGMPTNVCVGAEDPHVAFTSVKLLTSKKAMFRVYAGADVYGMEIAGAVKNVLAIASGAARGLGMGNNTTAALICRGLAEMKRLCFACGSNGACLSGLAGVGDLMLTCNSELSRNFSVGNRLAKGTQIEMSEDGVPNVPGGNGVAEGVLTAKSIHELCEKHGVDMPFCKEVYEVLYHRKPVKEAFEALMSRPVTVE